MGEELTADGEWLRRIVARMGARVEQASGATLAKWTMAEVG